ncbi:FCD domain-containing protein [Caballeronia sp. LZ035]|uniref:FadR/GntR family transcriptional regulator n=1 Tax=Caballeronia sp. LZ035 TaxID=3038568 RepID=UPI00285653CB|nr:FCD domain-containing protein [Caballeronia sp. LZ035]MDR5760560.1 FCD domain-containing protein [Caballeronia sp. LZ035]
MNTRNAAYRGKSQVIALDILHRIAESSLAPGATFATESDLLEDYAVSRPTLRESLRILESQGVLMQKPGPGGGLMVQKPTLDTFARNLSIFLRFHEVPFVDVLHAREAIEPALAAQAAAHGCKADFDALAQSIERMRSGCTSNQAFVAENRLFHGAIAHASGDTVLETFWGAISLLADGELHGVRYTEANREHVIVAHTAILDALRERDAARAAAAMSEHVGELEHLVRHHYEHMFKGVTRLHHQGFRRIEPA